MERRAPGSPSVSALVGRERELDRIDELVTSIQRGPQVVVIRGEAGIGKTTLWRHAIQLHRDVGHRTLVARPSEEELHGAILGLTDLFEGVVEHQDMLCDELDVHERGRRVLAALRDLAARAPVVVAIDDVQWLDPVTAGALRYAFRRLDDEPLLVLATERVEPSAVPDDRTLPADRRREIFLAPLGIDAIRLVVAPVAEALPRPVLERIHELSGGNPMYAIELARTAELFNDPLHTTVPPTLRAAMSSRITAAPDDVRAMLPLVAALGPSSAQTIAFARGSDATAAPVSAAVTAGLLTVGDDLLVRFTHPLLASAALEQLDPLERQALHGQLAAVVDDPDSRARHLALSCADPDAAIAAELHRAAERAARRGAPALAADFADHSVRTTPRSDVEQLVRRAFAAVVHRAAAGDKARALASADRLVAMLPTGPVRAEAIALRVAIDFDGGDQFLDQALIETGDDLALRGRILELRGWLAVVHRAELAKGESLALEALSIATRIGDRKLEMQAAGTVAHASLLLGRPCDDLLRHALQLAEELGEAGLGRGPLPIHGRHCLWCGQLDEARTIIEGLHATCLRSGTEWERPYRMVDLAALEVAAGNLDLAAEIAENGMEAAADGGNPQAAAWLAYPSGLANAHRGRQAAARDAAATLRGSANELDGRSRLVMAHHALGVAALAAGSPARAVTALAPGLELADQVGVKLPSAVPLLPDSIEAAALVGDVTRCKQLTAELDAQAAAVGQPWVEVAALRGRGLMALATGDEGAAALLAEAAEGFDRLGYRLDAARAMLHHGRALRRSGRRNASADVLVEVHRRFTSMGAAPWLAQAEAELERVAPGRERAELTPTETRIAELVAAGRRNREIAGELFVSVATVEAHLTRMYRKLHVRSRTELARVLS